MDLVRRKLRLHGGRLPKRFFAAVHADLDAAPDFIAGPLGKALAELESTTRWVQESYKLTPDDAAFGCVDFLRAFSLTYLGWRSEEHTSELQSLMRISYAVFCLKKKIHKIHRVT